MKNVIVVIGPGQIGQAIARRVGVGKHIILADVRAENATAAADVLSNAGFDVSVATVNASSRDAVHGWRRDRGLLVRRHQESNCVALRS